MTQLQKFETLCRLYWHAVADNSPRRISKARAALDRVKGEIYRIDHNPQN